MRTAPSAVAWIRDHSNRRVCPIASRRDSRCPTATGAAELSDAIARRDAGIRSAQLMLNCQQADRPATHRAGRAAQPKRLCPLRTQPSEEKEPCNVP
jgi:hypothetical protein